MSKSELNPWAEPRAFLAALPSAAYALQLPALLRSLGPALPPVCARPGFESWALSFGPLNRTTICGSLAQRPGIPDYLPLDDPEAFAAGRATCSGLCVYCPTYLRGRIRRGASRDPLLREAFPCRGRTPRLPGEGGHELYGEYLVLPLLALDSTAPHSGARLRGLLYQCLVQAECKGLPVLVHEGATSPGALPLLRELGFQPLSHPARASERLVLWPGHLHPSLVEIEAELLQAEPFQAPGPHSTVLPLRGRAGEVYRALQIDRELEYSVAACFLARAFADDGLKLVMQRRPEVRAEHVYALTRCLMEGTSHAGGNWLFLRADERHLPSEPEAVLLTTPADMRGGRWGDPMAFCRVWLRFGARLADLPSSLAFDRFHRVCCGDPRNHIYVAYISAHPLRRGAGLGGAMMRRVAAAADLTDSFVYLENSKEDNLGFYRKSGLRVVSPFSFEDAGAGTSYTGYAMLRPRRSEGSLTGAGEEPETLESECTSGALREGAGRPCVLRVHGKA